MHTVDLQEEALITPQTYTSKKVTLLCKCQFCFFCIVIIVVSIWFIIRLHG